MRSPRRAPVVTPTIRANNGVAGGEACYAKEAAALGLGQKAHPGAVQHARGDFAQEFVQPLAMSRRRCAQVIRRKNRLEAIDGGGRTKAFFAVATLARFFLPDITADRCRAPVVEGHDNRIDIQISQRSVAETGARGRTDTDEFEQGKNHHDRCSRPCRHRRHRALPCAADRTRRVSESGRCSRPTEGGLRRRSGQGIHRITEPAQRVGWLAWWLEPVPLLLLVLVPLTGIELVTFALRMRCSTD
jgi:hypothetical protein